jgi:methylated-DNA-[protein]-cysteine S-methyltransferase
MIDFTDSDDLLVFTSKLGWMSMIVRGNTIRQLTFGHATAKAAGEAIALGIPALRKLNPWQSQMVEKLRSYAAGIPVDFSDLKIDFGSVSDFQARVLKACQKIPYGETATYGALAAAARSLHAARAVGTCMAGNRIPLIIPCHRVVRSGGDIGAYSALGGAATKRRLLEMEAKTCLS